MPELNAWGTLKRREFKWPLLLGMLFAATLASLGILNLTPCIDCGGHAERKVLRMCSWLYLHHLYIPLVWCLDTEPLLVYCFESIVIYVINLPRYLFMKLEY